MNLKDQIWDVIIIGAGISGLSARRTMKAQGYHVLTFEKSRGLGGRAATRRVDGITFDLGAQFFSAKGPELQTLLASLHPHKKEELKAIQLADSHLHSRWIHSRGMSRVSSFLVEDPMDISSPILCSTRVMRLTFDSRKGTWQVVTEANEPFQANTVVISTPVPQSLELLSGIENWIDPILFKKLKDISYHSCIAAAYILQESMDIKDFGVLRYPSEEIAGIFNQSQKGILTTSPVLVVHTAPQWSKTLWSLPDSRILDEIWKKTQAILSIYRFADSFQSASVHKWRYSEPKIRQKEFFERIQIHPASTLFLVGDSFRDSRIEGAFESGRLAGMALANFNPRTLNVP